MTGIFYVLLSTAVKLFLENKTLLPGFEVEPETFQSWVHHYTTELSLLPYMNPQKYHMMSRLIHSSFAGAMI